MRMSFCRVGEEGRNWSTSERQGEMKEWIMWPWLRVGKGCWFNAVSHHIQGKRVRLVQLCHCSYLVSVYRAKVHLLPIYTSEYIQNLPVTATFSLHFMPYHSFTIQMVMGYTSHLLFSSFPIYLLCSMSLSGRIPVQTGGIGDISCKVHLKTLHGRN